MSIKFKILAAYGAILLIAGASFLIVLMQVYHEGEGLRQIDKGISHTSSSAVPLLKTIDNLRLDVVQVQQWLTDISATRGLSGLDDGFDEAKKAADQFHADLKKSQAYARELNLQAISKDLELAAQKFAPYYEAGVKMAQIYVKDGPEAGNKMMAGFDKVAEEIGTVLERLANAVENEPIRQLDRLSVQSKNLIAGNDWLIKEIIVMIAVGLFMIFGIIIYMFTTIRRDFGNLLGDLELVMARKFDSRFATDTNGKNEFATIGKALEVMREKLKEVDNLHAEQEAQKRRAEDEKRALMHAMADEFDANVGEIANTVSQASTELKTTAHSMTSIAEHGKNEFATIGKALEVMREKLKEVDNLHAEQEAQKRRAEDEKRALMHAMADEFDANVGEIANTVSQASTELKTTAHSMTSIAEQTNNQAITVSQDSQQATANVQAVASAAEEMSSTIAEIGQQVAQASGASRQAVSEVDRTAQQMDQLAQSASKIGNVIEMISGIAEQTNLLALNATIESARAGEAGKGFAVVANEVKELASQTAKATEEIVQQINGIQSATKDASDSMVDVGKVIQKVDEISTAIAAAIEEQEAATREITQNVQEAANRTQQVNSNIEQVAAASNEAGAASNQMMTSADRLSSKADLLKGEVDKFVSQVRAS